MKFILITVFIQSMTAIFAMANSENAAEEIVVVDMLPATSTEFPFLKAIGLEKRSNILTLEIDENLNGEFQSPLLLLPGSMVCIKRNTIKLKPSTDLSWVHDLFSAPQKQDDSLLELSKVNGDFVIRFTDSDLLLSFYERSDNVLFMTVLKIDATVTNKNNMYFVGFLPSSNDITSWRRTNDNRVSKLADALFSHTTKTPKNEKTPEK
jgi:hypothetical protein